MENKVGIFCQGLQFILVLGMVFRSLVHGQLDQVFFISLALYFLISAFRRLVIYHEKKNQIALFLGLSEALAGFLFFFIQ